MAFTYEQLINWNIPDVQQDYEPRDTMLYALGIGFGFEPTNEDELRFVYERDLETFPTMAVVLGHPGAWMADPEVGIDMVKVLHGEQHLEIHRPLPPKASIKGVNRVVDVIDKGEGKGALITVERRLFDAQSGEHYSTQSAVIFARGNGGFGGPKTQSLKPKALPDREPDLQVDIATTTQTALLYRLSGDYNPLHADPKVSAKAGFPAPILHGLASFGIAARAVLRGLGGTKTAKLRKVGLRFSSPVFPGETIRTEIWQEADDLRFCARVLERDQLVLNNGYAMVEKL